MNDASLSVSSKKAKKIEFFVLKTLSVGQENYLMIPHPKYLDYFDQLNGSDMLLKSCIGLLRVQLLASCIQFQNSFYYHNSTIELSSEKLDEEKLASDIALTVLKGMDVDLAKFKPPEDDDLDIEGFIVPFHHHECGNFYVQFGCVFGSVYRENYFMIKKDDIPKVHSLISRVGECLLPCPEDQTQHHQHSRHDPLIHSKKKADGLKTRLGISEEQFDEFDEHFREIAVLTFMIDGLQKEKKDVTSSNLHCIPHVQLFRLLLEGREEKKCLSFMITDILINLHQNSNVSVVHCNKLHESMKDYFEGTSKNAKKPLQDAYDLSRSNIQNILDAGGELYDEIKNKKVTQCKPKTLGGMCIMCDDKRKLDGISAEEGDSQGHTAKKQKTEGMT